MQSRKQKIEWVAILSFLCFTLICPQPVQAAEEVSLTIDYCVEEEPVSNAVFRLYRVGDVSAAGQYTLTGEFARYPVKGSTTDSADRRALAETLAAYVSRDHPAATDVGMTGLYGRLRFPSEQDSLQPGVFLVIGKSHSDGHYTYYPQPFLIELPAAENAVSVKYQRVENGTQAELRVLKVWKDEAGTSHRPENVTIHLLCDGAIYQTVTLNAANNWRNTWETLEAAHLWQVVEDPVPNLYSVAVSREENTFTVKNTYYGAPDPKPPIIPQLGSLRAPIYALAGLGMVLFLWGWVRHRKAEKRNEP